MLYPSRGLRCVHSVCDSGHRCICSLGSHANMCCCMLDPNVMNGNLQTCVALCSARCRGQYRIQLLPAAPKTGPAISSVAVFCRRTRLKPRAARYASMPPRRRRTIVLRVSLTSSLCDTYPVRGLHMWCLLPTRCHRSATG